MTYPTALSNYTPHLKTEPTQDFGTFKGLEELRNAMSKQFLSNNAESFKVFVIPTKEGVHLIKSVDKGCFNTECKNHAKTDIYLARNPLGDKKFKIELVVRNPTVKYLNVKSASAEYTLDDNITNAYVDFILRDFIEFYFQTYNKTIDDDTVVLFTKNEECLPQSDTESLY